jgi:hypothetical protein
MANDALSGGKNEQAEITCWEISSFPFFHLVDLDRIAWFNHTAVVDASMQLHLIDSCFPVLDILEIPKVSFLFEESQNPTNKIG